MRSLASLRPNRRFKANSARSPACATRLKPSPRSVSRGTEASARTTPMIAPAPAPAASAPSSPAHVLLGETRGTQLRAADQSAGSISADIGGPHDGEDGEHGRKSVRLAHAQPQQRNRRQPDVEHAERRQARAMAEHERNENDRRRDDHGDAKRCIAAAASPIAAATATAWIEKARSLLTPRTMRPHSQLMNSGDHQHEQRERASGRRRQARTQRLPARCRR